MKQTQHESKVRKLNDSIINLKKDSQIMETVQPSKLRAYFFEYTVIALATVVVYLFFQIGKLNEYIRGDLTNQRAEMVKAVYQNNVLLEKNSVLLEKNSMLIERLINIEEKKKQK